MNEPLNRKLRMGLVGGGQGSFIGAVHMRAALLDNRAELVAGALSSNPERSKASAVAYDIKADRAYGSYAEMAQAEAAKPENERIDFASVTTPNHTHFEIAKAFAEAGFNVVCDKPMTFDLAQAEELAKVVDRAGVVFALTHNYTGYPLVRQAREMALAGELGDIHAIRANYIQGWLVTKLEDEDHKQAGWRTDPTKSGIAGAFGDIGTHAYNLGRFITGLLPDEISAHLKVFVPGRPLDDYGTAVIRFQNGALGTVTASQISHGRENDLRIEVDGTKASLEWHQEEPNKLYVRANGEPMKVYTRNPDAPFSKPTAVASSRLPGGHPEAFFEAFANVYAAAFDDMIKRSQGASFDREKSLYPNAADGIDGLNFITQCVESSKQNGAWLKLAHAMCRA